MPTTKNISIQFLDINNLVFRLSNRRNISFLRNDYYRTTKINYKYITYASIGYAGEDALNDANSPTVVSQGSASSLSDYVSGKYL